MKLSSMPSCLKKSFLCLLLLSGCFILFSTGAYAQQPRAEEPYRPDTSLPKQPFYWFNVFCNTVKKFKDTATYAPPKVEYIAGIVPNYSPENSLCFNGGGMLYFNSLDWKYNYPQAGDHRFKFNPLLKSNLYINVAATILNQFFMELKPEFFFLQQRIKVQGYIYTGIYPYKFWGIGKDAQEEDKENYTNLFYRMTGLVDYRFYKGLKAGVGFQYYYNEVVAKEKGGILDTRDIYGQGKTQGLGVTARLSFDNRDNHSVTKRGNFSSLEVLYNTSTFGQSEPFWKVRLDLRQFFHIPQRKYHIDHVFGINLVSVSCIGEQIPFQELAHLGARNQYARGIFDGRYIDHYATSLQIEYRFYWKWLGAVLFGAFSDIGHRFKDAWQFDVISFGAGLRLLPLKNTSLALCLDFGFSGNFKTPMVYIGMNELF